MAHPLLSDLPGGAREDVEVEDCSPASHVPPERLGVSAFVIQLLVDRAESREELCTDYYERVIEPWVWNRPPLFSLAASLPCAHPASRQALVSHATCYVVFPRDSSVCEVLQAILFFAKHHPGHYFWMDMLSSSPAEAKFLSRTFLLETLPERIRAIDTMLLVESDLDEPTALKRQWCLWELMCASDAGKQVYVTEMSEGREAFSFERRDKFLRIISRVIRVCWDDAETSSRQHGMRFAGVHRQQSCVDQRIVQILTPAVAQYTKDICAEDNIALDRDLIPWVEIQLMGMPVEKICALVHATPEALVLQDQVGRNLLYHAALLLRLPSRHDALRHIIPAIIETHPDSVKVPIDSGWVPLYSALSSSPPLDIVKVLLEAFPESVRMPNKQGDWFPLHVAVANQASLDVVLYLLSLFPEVARMNTNNGSTMLHFAVRNAAGVDVIKLLLETYPESPTVENKNGWLPLHEAVFCDSPLEVVRMLVEANKSALWVRTGLKWLPAHVIVSDDFRVDVFDYLLEMYPDAVEQNDGDGWLLLHALSSSHSPQSCVEKVYNMYPEAVKLRNMEQKLPLHLAIMDGQRMETVEFLISKYPEALNANSVLGRKALHLAATCGNVRIVEIVHRSRPDVLRQECIGRKTPLQWACAALEHDSRRVDTDFEVFKYLWEVSEFNFLRISPQSTAEADYIATLIRRNLKALSVSLKSSFMRVIMDAVREQDKMVYLSVSQSSMRDREWGHVAQEVGSSLYLRHFGLHECRSLDREDMTQYVIDILRRSRTLETLSLVSQGQVREDAEALRRVILRHPCISSFGNSSLYQRELDMVRRRRAQSPWSIAAHTGTFPDLPQPTIRATQNVLFLLMCFERTELWLPPELRTFILEFLRLDELSRLASEPELSVDMYRVLMRTWMME